MADITHINIVAPGRLAELAVVNLNPEEFFTVVT